MYEFICKLDKPSPKPIITTKLMSDSNLTEHQLLASADSIVMKDHHKA